jgi:hypothetical protein
MEEFFSWAICYNLITNFLLPNYKPCVLVNPGYD